MKKRMILAASVTGVFMIGLGIFLLTKHREKRISEASEEIF